MLTDYEIQARKFARNHGVRLQEISCDFGIYFDGDTEERYIYKMRLLRNRKSYTFTFGQSIANGAKTPTIYDVLSCMQKYDIGTFEDFCREFGYDTDSRRAERTYKAVCKEWKAVERLFGDCLDELREIC